MQLRPYQITGKLLLSELFQRGIKACIAMAPTGSGKTVTFTDIARDTNLNGGSVMILCHRVELISQAKDKLNKCGLYPTIIDPTWHGKESNLYVASVDTLRNRQLPEVDLLIIDECHYRSFDEIVLQYIALGTLAIGFTATPRREGKSKIEGNDRYTGQLWDVYQEMVTFATIPELLEQNFLVPGIPIAPKHYQEIDVKLTNTIDGPEYNQADMFKKFNKPELYAGVVDYYLKFSKSERAIVFNIDVEHSKLMTEEFIRRGIPAVHVDAKSKYRKQAFEDFKSGRVLVLNNVGIATTGTDIPPVTTIILNRMIHSESLYLQMCGRGSRLCPEINKTHFKYLDFGGNIKRLGYWHDEREYSIDPVNANKKKGIAPTKQCEACECIIPAASTSCPYCQVMQPQKEQEEMELSVAEFEILDPDAIPEELKKPVAKMTIKELEKYREFKKYKIGWIVRQLFSRGPEALYEYSHYKNYSSKWAQGQIEHAQGRKDAVKDEVWIFITKNIHLPEDQVKLFIDKKLKADFSLSEIEEMTPNIFNALLRYKSGEIDIEGNELKLTNV